MKARLVAAETDVVTLVGPGGVGKTRLALAVAHTVTSAFADGSWWVELAGLSGAGDVGTALLRALALTPLPGEDAADAVRRHASSRRLLLALDNFEHVIEAAALVADLGVGARS